MTGGGDSLVVPVGSWQRSKLTTLGEAVEGDLPGGDRARQQPVEVVRRCVGVGSGHAVEGDVRSVVQLDHGGAGEVESDLVEHRTEQLLEGAEVVRRLAGRRRRRRPLGGLRLGRRRLGGGTALAPVGVVTARHEEEADRKHHEQATHRHGVSRTPSTG